MAWQGDIVVVRGGGDLATGVVQKLVHAGCRVVILETAQPLAIRRTVALCTAVYEGRMQVEDMTAVLVQDTDALESAWQREEIPVLIDPSMACLPALSPVCVVDAILAKKNIGLRADLAPIVIALGPGFTAPEDAHAIVETMRGHDLGRVLWSGSALPNTGVPGVIGGQGAARVLRAPCAGQLRQARSIGDIVEAGDLIFTVEGCPVHAPFAGVLRGLLQEGLTVPKGMKAADIDPRKDSDCYTISDKARCIGGGVLDAYCYLRRRL